MNALFENSSIFETIISSLKDSFPQVSVHFTEQGISFNTADSGHIVMSTLKIDKSDLKEYSCKEPVECGIDIKVFNSFLNCGSKDSTLKLSYSKDDPNVLSIQYRNNISTSNFTLKLIDIEMEELIIPEIEFDSIFTMPSTEFSSTCKNLTNLGDEVYLKTTKSTFKFLVNGTNGDADIVLKPQKSLSIIGEDGKKIPSKIKPTMKLVVTTPCSCKISLPQLKQYSSCTSVSKHVSIHLKENFPVFLKYKFYKNSYFGFFIAPKFED